jgi:hypothetical protein
LTADNIVRITSREARQQLLATHMAPGGTAADATRKVQWTVSDPAVLTIDATGMAVPLADGTVTATATLDDLQASVDVHISGFAAPRLVNFRNEIVPVFTKLGCNGGGCHGKSGGQNGFKLSLLGFYPEDDFEFLRKESRGRRIFPARRLQDSALTAAASAWNPAAMSFAGSFSGSNRECRTGRLLIRSSRRFAAFRKAGSWIARPSSRLPSSQPTPMDQLRT